ncbi:MAG TPA: peptidylprolyl isomerase [Mycobacterium sp.]
MPTEKQRRATAKRKLERQLQRRQKQARRNRILAIAALAGVIILVAGLVVWKLEFAKKSTTASTSSSPTSAAPSQDAAAASQAGVLPPFKAPDDLGANCTYPPSPEPAAKKVEAPKAGKVPTDPAKVSVSMMTNQGPVGLQLNNAQAPCTVNSFASLAQKGYFNDTPCHRLTTGNNLFVLQCGDPGGDGKGGPGYEFADEYPTNQYASTDPALTQPVLYPRGTLAMANAGPDTNGSQFFLVYKDSKLPPKYTVFGTIDETGLGTLDKIATAGTTDGSPDGKPKTDVVIKSVQLD